MRHLETISILLAICCITPSFAQTSSRPLSQNGMTQTQAPVSPRNTWTKRLRGESTFSISLSGNASTFLDSIQHVYDAQNRLAESLNRSFVNGHWMLQSRIQYLQYDSSGHVLQETFQTTNDNGQSWYLKRQTTTTYFPLGYYDILVKEWENGDYTTHSYEYDPQGNLYGELFYPFYWNYNNTYDQDNFLVSVLKVHYFNSYIFYDLQKLFVYDSLHPGRLVNALTYDFNAWGSYEYALIDSMAYTYDPSGKLLTSDHFEFDYPFDCQPIRRQIQSFSAQQRLSRQENLETCAVIDSIPHWQTTATTDYLYDMDGDPISWSRQEYSDTDTILFFHQYTYETVSRVQEQPSAMEWTLFPNPASGTLFLKTAPGSVHLAKIFDLTGRALHSYVLQGNEIETLSLEGMPEGHYLVQVMGREGQKATKPIIIGH